MNNESEIQVRVERVVAGVLRLSELPADLEIGTHGWDSLNQMHIVAGIEKEFSTRLTMRDFVGLTSIPAIVRTLGEKLA